MITRISLLLLFAILFSSSQAQQNQPQSIQWMSFKEAFEKQKKQPKKIFVDVYTDWCGWCKRMDVTTFANPQIAEYINTHYYAVKFDAEGIDTIVYKGKQYINPTYGKKDANGNLLKKSTHQFAVELLGQRISYPSIVYMDDSSNVIAPIGGYRNAKDIQPFLIYFAEEYYKYANLQDFVNEFSITFTDSLQPKKLHLEWKSMQYAIDNSVKEQKKVLVLFESPWCVVCNMMKLNAFNDTSIVNYINKTFIPVAFDALSKDSVVYANQTFVNEGKEHPFHQFAVGVLSGKMQFPTIALLSPEHSLIQLVPGFFTNVSMKPALHYFGSEAYKTQTWDDFLKTFKP